MDTRRIEHLLVLQTMLLAAGVLTFSLEVPVTGVGTLLGIVFPEFVLLGGVAYVLGADADDRERDVEGCSE